MSTNLRSKLDAVERALDAQDGATIRLWLDNLTDSQREALNKAQGGERAEWAEDLTHEELTRLTVCALDDQVLWLLLQIAAKHALPGHEAPYKPYEMTTTVQPAGWRKIDPMPVEYYALTNLKIELFKGFEKALTAFMDHVEQSRLDAGKDENDCEQ